MRCPKCHVADTKVLESRLSADGALVRRRRACLECPHRFTTYEKAEELAFQIQKKDGRFEPYAREKALRSLQIACQKRPITIDEIECLLNAVEKTLQDEGDRTIPSRRLGDLIMEGLRKLDHVAYVRFASVYKEFHTPEEFVAELKSLKD